MHQQIAEISDKLSTLNDQEIAKVSKLVDKLAAKKNKLPKSIPIRDAEVTASKDGKSLIVKDKPQSRPVKTEVKPASPTTQVKSRPALRDVVRPGGNSRPAQGGNSNSERKVVRGVRGNKVLMGRGEKLAMPAPINTGPRENEFEKLVKTNAEFNQDKKRDIAFDKKNPCPRMPRMARPAVEEWVLCSGGCGMEHLVNVNLCTTDDNGNLSYRCNDCIVGNKH